MGNLFMFYILSFITLFSAIACVVTKRVVRAATYMFFMLLGVAGLYFLLGYTFLGTAQIAVYAGGVAILYIFAIQLVNKQNLRGLVARMKGPRVIFGGLMSLIGAVIVILVVLHQSFDQVGLQTLNSEIPMKIMGTSLLGSEKYQYLLPFEFMSVFLLACIIGGIIISRKEERRED